jgi:hypothetical protein
MDPGEVAIQKMRSMTGLLAVVVGDVAIAAGAILGLLLASGSDGRAQIVVSILGGAFTAIGTLTTAYFGIRAASNTAQSSINAAADKAATDKAAADTAAADKAVVGG